MSMPDAGTLQQYEGAAVSVVYAMRGNPYELVQMPDGRELPFWMTQAVELHLLRLRIDALRQMGLA